MAYKIDQKLLSIGPKSSCEILEKTENKLAYKLI